MERRGIGTRVVERLGREALVAAERRLVRAAELGRVERESRALAASILDLSGNLAAARREHALMLARAPTRAPARSLGELQREGRERWLAMRAEAKEPAPESAPEKRIGKIPERERGRKREGPEYEP